MLLSLGSCIATLLAQRHTVGYSETIPLGTRLANALTSCISYLGQIAWPAKLAVFYPDTSDQVLLATVAFSALLLSGITMVVFQCRLTRPYVVVGWMWYLICLLPVIGIVRVGLQGQADRYTYLPQIGLCIGLAWTIADGWIIWSARLRRTVIGGAIAIVVIFAWRATIQVSFWKDTESLWNHAIAVTENNDVAHNNMASLLMQRGQLDQAIAQYQAALRAGSPAETHTHLSPAIIENSLGNAFAKKNQVNTAKEHYRKALQLRPDYSDAHTNLATMLSREGNLTAAISEYQKVIGIPPEDAASHQRLAAMLVKANREREAVAHYQRAVQLAPDSLDSLNALAWLRARSGDGSVRNPPEALRVATHANQVSHGKDAVVLRILAASYAASGDLARAAIAVEEALPLSPAYPGLGPVLDAELAQYRGAASK